MAEHDSPEDERPWGRSVAGSLRAVLGIVLTELICLVLLATISVAHERRVRLRALTVMLEGRADSLFGGVQDAEDPGDTVQLDPREIRIPRGDFYAVYDEGGRQIGASEPAPPDLLHLQPASSPPFRTERVGRHSYRVMQRPYLRIVDRGESQTSGVPRPITIVYATEIDRIWREIFEAVEYYLGVSLALLLTTTVILVGFLRSVLRPIEALAEAAGAVSPRQLTFEATPEALAVRELRPLALALTTMIDELRLTFDRQHRFLGDAAHELKTAVAVVRSSLQLLLLRPRPAASYEEGLHAALEDNERAERLVSRMLLMARLEEPQPHQHARGSLRVAVNACVEKVWPLLEQAGLRVEVLWPESSGIASTGSEAVAGRDAEEDRPVPVGPEDLDVLVSNLLMNAIEHSAPELTITVRGRYGESGVWLDVIDRGEGIPDDAQPHIFERFFRADQSRTRKTGGAGLGLSIAKAIADSVGGTITVASKLGRGTEMSVYLPFAPGG